MELSDFHPAVREWFSGRFEAETPVQAGAWREIASGKNVLIAAPTGSGKTFAAFLCAINELVEQSRRGPLQDGVQVLYVSPLRALGNDIRRNLHRPLAELPELFRGRLLCQLSRDPADSDFAEWFRVDGIAKRELRKPPAGIISQAVMLEKVVVPPSVNTITPRLSPRPG